MDVVKRSGNYVIPAADASERELTATLCSDILRLRSMMGVEHRQMSKARSWLNDQQGTYCDNPLALRLILTESLLISMGLVLNQQCGKSPAAMPDEGEVIYTDPIGGQTLRPLSLLSFCVTEFQSREGKICDLSSQLNDARYKKLEQACKDQTDRLHSAIAAQKQLEAELQQERREGLRRSQELMSLKLERRTERQSQPEPVKQPESPSGSPHQRGRIHRLFSSSKLLPNRTTSNNGGLASRSPSDSSIKSELTSLLRTIKPPSNNPLTPEEISAVTQDVFKDLSEYLDTAHEIVYSPTQGIPAVENEVSELKDNAQLMGHKFEVGVTLVEETKRKVELLTERCQTLEALVDDKEKRVHSLESALACGNASSAAILSLQQELEEVSSSKLLLEKTISALSAGQADISNFINTELQSMRGAFAIKLDLASQKLASANSEINALRGRIYELEDGIAGGG